MKNSVAGGKALSLSKKGFTCSAWPVMGAPVKRNWCQKLVDELGIADDVTLVASESGSYCKNTQGKYRPMPKMEGGVDSSALFDRLDAAEAIMGIQDVFLRGGGFFCQGGYGALADACLAAVRRCGSTVLMHTRVNRILIEGGRATGIETREGAIHRAPVVISNAGIRPTVLRLAGEEAFPTEYIERVKGLVPSQALLGYRYFLEEPITDKGFGVVFSDSSPWSSARLAAADRGEASREGVLYFEAPNNYHPGAAPAGKQVILTGSFCPPDPSMSKESITAWADAGEEIFFGLFPPGARPDRGARTSAPPGASPTPPATPPCRAPAERPSVWHRSSASAATASRRSTLR